MQSQVIVPLDGSASAKKLYAHQTGEQGRGRVARRHPDLLAFGESAARPYTDSIIQMC